MTPDGNPILGWSNEVEGFFQSVGTCGQGFMLGPGMGELISRMIMHSTIGNDEEIIKILSPYRNFSGHEILK